ncbi:MAG: zinc ribbon domain-containing protein [Thermomicrobiales bacterium]
MEQHQMTQSPAGSTQYCPVCRTPYHAGDRFCSACGTTLPAAGGAITPVAPGERAVVAPATRAPEPDSTFWVLSAAPSSVMLGGVLLLILALALLLVGQLDPTSTLVIISFMLAPLGLLVLAFGVLRAVLRLFGIGRG